MNTVFSVAADKAPSVLDRSEVFRGLELGEGMTLGGLGRALAASSDELMQEISRHVRRLVDLPADVYRVVVDTPDERRVRDHLQACGSEVLTLVVPVTRAIVAAGEVLPGGPLLQPVLLGKVFGVHDYVQDRADALRALPELPTALLEEARGLHEFVHQHPNKIRAATHAMPPASAFRRLGQLDFWKEAASEEWTATRERIDAHYVAVAKNEARLERDLPIFRAAYALAYYTLGHLDPVAATLAEITPSGVGAYQRYASHRERFARIVARLRAADVEVPVPDFVEEVVEDETSALSGATAPADPGHQTLQYRLQAPAPLEAPHEGALSPPLRAPSQASLPSASALPQGLAGPVRSELPGLATRLQLRDPGLGADPTLGAAPALVHARPLAVIRAPVGRGAPPRAELPTAPSAPAGGLGLPEPRRPEEDTAPHRPAGLDPLGALPPRGAGLPEPRPPESPAGLPASKRLFS